MSIIILPSEGAPDASSTIIAANRAVLAEAPGSVTSFFPNGWTVTAKAAGFTYPRVEVEVLRFDQRVMRLSVDAEHVKLIPCAQGLAPEQMNKIADRLANAIGCHLDARAGKGVSADLAAAIHSLDAAPSATRRMSMAGRPEQVLAGSFRYGPGDADSIKPWLEDGDVLVTKREAGPRSEPAIEGMWVMRGGRFDPIDEIELRQMAGCAAGMEP